MVEARVSIGDEDAASLRDALAALATVGTIHLSSGGTAQPNSTTYHVAFIVPAAFMALRFPDAFAVEPMHVSPQRDAAKEPREPLLVAQDDQGWSDARSISYNRLLPYVYRNG